MSDIPRIFPAMSYLVGWQVQLVKAGVGCWQPAIKIFLERCKKRSELTCQWTGHPCESGTSELHSFPPELQIPVTIDVLKNKISLGRPISHLERNFARPSHKLEELGSVSLIEASQGSPEPEVLR